MKLIANHSIPFKNNPVTKGQAFECPPGDVGRLLRLKAATKPPETETVVVKQVDPPEEPADEPSNESEDKAGDEVEKPKRGRPKGSTAKTEASKDAA